MGASRQTPQRSKGKRGRERRRRSSKYSPQHPVLKLLNLCPSLSVTGVVLQLGVWSRSYKVFTVKKQLVMKCYTV
jgi:hypothetical protein